MLPNYLIGALQQKKPSTTLEFQPVVSPTAFDRTTQDVDIFDVFARYYITVKSALYAYSVNNIVTTFNLDYGTSYRYGYTSGGIDTVVDVTQNTTTLSGNYNGSYTTINVASTASFPATGRITFSNGDYFLYTSKTATSFTGASQSVIQTTGTTVYQSQFAIDWTGTTKRWVIVNHVTTNYTNITVTMNIAGPVWLYCGSNITKLNFSGASSTIKYVHCHDNHAITSTLGNGNTAIVDTLYLADVTTANSGFANCTNLTKIVILNTVVTIYTNTFLWDAKITSVTFEATSKLATIQGSAFKGCSALTSIAFPDSLITLSNGTVGAFYQCTNLTTVTFGSGLQTIGDGGCFQSTNFTAVNLTFPDSLISIGTNAFYGLTKITGSLTFPNVSFTTISQSAFYGCTGITSLSLSSTITTIGIEAFLGCTGMTGTLTMTSGILSIGEGCFGKTNFTSFDVSANARFELGDSNTIMYEVLPAGTVKAFHAIKGTSGAITLRNDTTRIANYCFYYNLSRTGSPSFPSSLTQIGYGAFWGSSSIGTALTIPNTLTSIEVSAFRECSGITSVSIGTGLSIINSAVFMYSGITTVTFPNNIITIDTWAFAYDSSLTQVTFGNALQTIGQNAFVYCSSLTNIGTLPSTLKTIGTNAFAFGPVLTGSLNLPSALTSMSSGTLELYTHNWTSITSDSSTYPAEDNVVYSGTTALFSARGYSGTLTLKTGTTAISAYCFRNNSNRSGTLTLLSTITSIGASAFAGCSGFTRCDSYPSTAPSTSSSFGNYAIPLHVPTSGGTGYGVAPWTTTAIFSSKTADL